MENHRTIRPKHINAIGTLFGGDILRWFDEESALYVYECLSKDCPRIMTSVAIYSFNFLKPAFSNQRIKSKWQIVHIGKTSITVKGLYEKWEDNSWVKFAQGYSCLCAIDANGKPVTYSLKPEINFEKIKSNKEWEIVENLKSLTSLKKK